MVIVAVVGPCASGKSTLVAALRDRGYDARHVAQEHSYVPDMWLQMTHPRALIYLEASFETINSRRRLNWTLSDYQEQLRRLTHAREHADLFLSTNDLTPEQLISQVLTFLQPDAM